MATEKGSLFDAVSGFNPASFAANVAAEAINTPNTSASGDITTGASTFGSVNVSRGVPWYVWATAAVLAFVYITRR
jgi:hypothetical protein